MPGEALPPQSPRSSKQTKIPGAQPVTVNVSHTRECVTLSKGPHRWTFSCPPGEEKTLLMRLAELARSEEVPFDWFDAALVSHQLRNRLLPGLARNDPNRPNATPG